MRARRTGWPLPETRFCWATTAWWWPRTAPWRSCDSAWRATSFGVCRRAGSAWVRPQHPGRGPVEILGSMAGAPRIGQRCRARRTRRRAYRAQNGKSWGRPPFACKLTTGTGYELSALIPLSLLTLDKTTNPTIGERR